MNNEPRQLDPDGRRELEDAWERLESDDLEGAWRLLTSLKESASDLPDVIELEAELALAEDDPETALDAYSRWSAADPDDPEPWLGTAEVYLEYYDEPGQAARLLRELLAGPPLDPVEEADARHVLGIACEGKNDRRGMITEWLAVLRLDALNDGPQPLLTRSEFEQIAADALDELPDEVLFSLRNVPILVEDRPSEALVLEGLDPRTLGLFHGIAMPDQSFLGPGPETGLIHLFQRNIEREVEDEEDADRQLRTLKKEIRITVLHETAHYFGASEDELRRFGLN